MSESITRMQDYAVPGGMVDWGRYKAAKVANGENCQVCGQTLSVFGDGKPRSCLACRDAVNRPQHSLAHNVMIRCPACRQLFTGPQKGIDYNRGYLDVMCPACEHEFDVEIEVSVSFHSPKVAP